MCVFMLMGMHTGVVVCVTRHRVAPIPGSPPWALGKHLQPLSFPYAPCLLSLTQSLIQRDYELTSLHPSLPRWIGPDFFFFLLFFSLNYYYDFSVKRELLIM